MDIPDRFIPTVKLNPKTADRTSLIKTKGLFIKGPIPMAWLSGVAKLPGKSMQVALALFWLAAMRPNDKVKMTRQAMRLFNVSDDSYRDAIPRLEAAGLIKVWRAPGRRAQVEIVRDIAPATKPGL
jgi:hypothetical protein